MTSEVRDTGMEHVGYEYREITVPRELSSLCLDSYPCFGWETGPQSGNFIRRTLEADRFRRSLWEEGDGHAALPPETQPLQ